MIVWIRKLIRFAIIDAGVSIVYTDISVSSVRDRSRPVTMRAHAF